VTDDSEDMAIVHLFETRPQDRRAECRKEV